VAEGVATAPAALKLVERYKLRAPMIRAMAAVLAGEVTMRDAAETLMRHPATSGESDSPVCRRQAQHTLFDLPGLSVLVCPRVAAR